VVTSRRNRGERVDTTLQLCCRGGFGLTAVMKTLEHLVLYMGDALTELEGLLS
jgi:hypothetical protein